MKERRKDKKKRTINNWPSKKRTNKGVENTPKGVGEEGGFAQDYRWDRVEEDGVQLIWSNCIKYTFVPGPYKHTTPLISYCQSITPFSSY